MNAKIYVDFQNETQEGLVRLNAKGTVDDLTKYNIKLAEDLELYVSDGELDAVGIVKHLSEGGWGLAILGELKESASNLA